MEHAADLRGELPGLRAGGPRHQWPGTVGGIFQKNGTHFGWVVEIDPHDPNSVPVKHTWLGRFRHENVALRTRAECAGHCLPGRRPHQRSRLQVRLSAPFVPGSTANKGLLADGRLFSAQFNADGTGRWIELAPATALNPYPGSQVPTVPAGATTLGAVYGTQGNILIDAYRASNLAGATPTARPEDVEVHPIGQQRVHRVHRKCDGAEQPVHQHLRRAGAAGGRQRRRRGTTFTWQRWKAGGPNNEALAGHVFAAPDNLSFDKAGNMWVVSDISSANLNGANANYTAFKNNGFFFIPTSGPHAGSAFQFASGPCECELTGPSWTPDEQTLFLAVQHPGELSGTRRGSRDRTSWQQLAARRHQRTAIGGGGHSTPLATRECGRCVRQTSPPGPAMLREQVPAARCRPDHIATRDTGIRTPRSRHA